MKQLLKDFREFALKGNVIDLAVAVVIGVAFNAVVTSLVNDVIMPFIAAIIGKPASQIGPVQCSLVADQKLGTAKAESGTTVNTTTNHHRRRSVSCSMSKVAEAAGTRSSRPILASELASPATAQGVTMIRM